MNKPHHRFPGKCESKPSEHHFTPSAVMIIIKKTKAQ
jgi:hypothetical protein